MTIARARVERARSRASTTWPTGTATTTTSAPRDGVLERGRDLGDRAELLGRAATRSASRSKPTISCPRRASARPTDPPMRPVPTTATRTASYSGRSSRSDRAPSRYTWCSSARGCVAVEVHEHPDAQRLAVLDAELAGADQRDVAEAERTRGRRRELGGDVVGRGEDDADRGRRGRRRCGRASPGRAACVFASTSALVSSSHVVAPRSARTPTAGQVSRSGRHSGRSLRPLAERRRRTAPAPRAAVSARHAPGRELRVARAGRCACAPIGARDGRPRCTCAAPSACGLP